MPESKYLVTVNSETGEATKAELIGEAGELTEVDLGSFVGSNSSTPSLTVPSVVINIFAGSAQTGAPMTAGERPKRTQAFEVIGPTIPRVVNPPRPGPPKPPPAAAQPNTDK